MVNAPERKLKLAIQFFGHLRTYKSCMPNLKKNLLNFYDYDIFMHTWSTLDHNTKTWHNFNPKKGVVTASALERELSNCLGNVKAVLVEKQEPKALGEISSCTRLNGTSRTMSIFGIASMYHSMAEASRLREEYARRNATQYDFVFCIRPDILLKKPIKISELMRFLTNEQLNEVFFTMAKPLYPFVEGIRQMVMMDSLYFARPAVISDILNHRQEILAKLQDKMVLNNPPEYEFIKNAKCLGYTPYFATLQYGRDFEILRHASSWGLRKRFIKLTFRKKTLHVYFFQGLARQILRIRLNISELLRIDFCIGNPNTD